MEQEKNQIYHEIRKNPYLSSTITVAEDEIKFKKE